MAAGGVHVRKGGKAARCLTRSHTPDPADMFRLVDGYREAPGTSGRLEVFYNGVWGTITGVSTGQPRPAPPNGANKHAAAFSRAQPKRRRAWPLATN